MAYTLGDTLQLVFNSSVLKFVWLAKEYLRCESGGKNRLCEICQCRETGRVL